MNCPGCCKPLDTSLTSCDRCGWQIPLARCIPLAEHERLLSEARNKALEDAAKVAERDCDWIGFGKAGIEQWDGGPDAVRDYRLGIRAGRSIAAAIRALVLD